jgi:hypothetical protein
LLTAVTALIPIAVYAGADQLRALVVAPLRALAPLVLDRRHCFNATGGAVPPTEVAGDRRPAHRFGVALVHVPSSSGGRQDAEQREILDIATRNRLRYCREHGYAFLNGTDWALRRPALMEALPGRRTHWLKSLFLQDVLRRSSEVAATGDPPPSQYEVVGEEETYPVLDWILFLDTDVMILNRNVRMEQILAGAAHPDEALVVTTEADRVNAGAFLVANTAQGRAVMDLWATGHLTDAWSDQAYFRTIFDAESRKLKVNETWPGNVTVSVDPVPRFRVVRPCALQSGGGLEYSNVRGRPYWEGFYARGDFAVHFFGRPDKLNMMRMAERGSLGFFS